MKARHVASIRLGSTGEPGEIELRYYPAGAGEDLEGKLAGIAYRCPGCGAGDWMEVGWDSHGWTWNGSVDAPTLRPSILHRPCGWHGYLTDGEFTPC